MTKTIESHIKQIAQGNRNSIEENDLKEDIPMNDNKKCQACGSNDIRKEIRTETFSYKGKDIPIENYAIIHCNSCGEEFADAESRERSIPVLRDAQRLIDGFLTSQEIKQIRKQFNLTQIEFGELLGGGEKAFARYETGKVLQSRPMDNLLRLLRTHPEAIETLKNCPINEGLKYTEVTSEPFNYNPKPVQSPFPFIVANDFVYPIEKKVAA